MENMSSTLSILQTQTVRQKMTAERILKLFLVLSTHSVFIYLNCVMFIAVRSKETFREMPRYILFAHMLFNDTLYQLISMVLYIFNVLYLDMVLGVCSFLILISTSTVTNEPLNLAVMSLERYFAVCFPLRYAQLSTPERTFFTLAVMWAVGAANVLIDIFTVILVEPSFFLLSGMCSYEQLMRKRWQRDKGVALNVLCFTVVGMVLLYTYVCITLEARSATRDRASAQKAMQTVLLHAVQLCLSLMTFLFNVFEMLLSSFPSDVFAQLRFVNYVVVLLLPRCLSPLIYGMRDQSFRPVFMYFFTCGTRSVKPAGTNSRLEKEC